MIWVLSNDPKLSSNARKLLNRPGIKQFVSIVSIWEVLLKHQAGKLFAGKSVDRVVDTIEYESSWSVLGVKTQHLRTLNAIPDYTDHKDPFDRLLIAQAVNEGLDIITADAQFARYGIKVVW